MAFFTIAHYGLPNFTLQIQKEKAVSQKVSFRFLTEDISFSTIALYGLPNITFQISQEQS